MKHLLIALALLSGSAFAAEAHKNNVLADVSMARGGFHFGAGYEYIYNGAQGIGGQLQFFSKSTSDKTRSDGALVIGAMTGFHFYKGDWDFALTPSVNIINIDGVDDKKGSKTTLGPGISTGLTTALNDKVAIGFNFQNYYVWFGDEYRGFAISDLSFRVKVGF